MAGQERQLKAIVFSDVVDSSLNIFADELIAIQRIKEDLKMIREELQRHGGSLVKSLGDGLLATFDGPTQALEFVQAAVQRLRSRGRQSLAHRFGLHTGEIYADGDDILGQGVHLASRLQTVSPANGVAFVRSTYELIDPRFRHRAISMGQVELKGLPEKVQTYYLGPDELLQFGITAGGEAFQIEQLLLNTPFELVNHLGRSPLQQTLLVRERQRERQAVMKVIPADPALAEALQVEAACLDRLRHPRIPRVLDGFAHAGRFCFIQEYIPGPSLQGSMDLLRRKQRLAELLRQILQVLEVVHAAGLVHGDIHPANLIPALEGNQVFLVDFSLLKARIEASRAQGASAPTTLSEAGRPFFSAPERARFGRLTAAADLYALGVSSLALYTGQDPSDLYDESRGYWSMAALEPEVIGWLSPLLEDLTARRLHQASDALRLLDQPQQLSSPIAVPLTTIPRQSASKGILQTQLLSTYGPMVELLLESQPSLIAPFQLQALQERLVAAGLAIADVQAAIAQALIPAEDGTEDESKQECANKPTSATDVAAPVQGPFAGETTHSPGESSLQLVRQVIGPIADFLWNEDMAKASESNPALLRELLLGASVPPSSVDTVLQYLSANRSMQAPQQRQAPAHPLDVTPATAASKGLTKDTQEILIHFIGPIGSFVWAEVANLPAKQQTQSILKLLREYGLDTDTLATISRDLSERGLD